VVLVETVCKANKVEEEMNVDDFLVVDQPFILKIALSTLEADGIDVEDILSREIPLEVYESVREQAVEMAALSLLIEAVVLAGCETATSGKLLRLVFFMGWRAAR